ncbi:hypothetical protein [Kitasatospora sp. LaBMicrA B282]|uniref:hypothetical protein n=1 Tax=Kitasatospora sp. LaBMicrA B282 TaxID=3420949 RepID=UPI003D1263E5
MIGWQRLRLLLPVGGKLVFRPLYRRGGLARPPAQLLGPLGGPRAGFLGMPGREPRPLQLSLNPLDLRAGPAGLLAVPGVWPFRSTKSWPSGKWERTRWAARMASADFPTPPIPSIAETTTMPAWLPAGAPSAGRTSCSSSRVRPVNIRVS